MLHHKAPAPRSHRMSPLHEPAGRTGVSVIRYGRVSGPVIQGELLSSNGHMFPEEGRYTSDARRGSRGEAA